MRHWFLIHTKIRQENVALENLELQGYECFLPQINSEKLRNGSLQVVREPLFPRYLFIRLGTDLASQSWSPIRSTLGVSRLVSFGHAPAKIEEELVCAIRTQTDTTAIRARHFREGEAVIVTDGPFAGLEAIYQMASGEGRVMVLLNLMSKQVKMTLGPSSLRKVN
jgi:transcriptional antiterminator RfaH